MIIFSLRRYSKAYEILDGWPTQTAGEHVSGLKYWMDGQFKELVNMFQF